MRSSKFCFLLFICLFTSCTSPTLQATVTPTAALATNASLQPSPTVTLTPSPTPIPVIPRAQYTLDALMDYDRKRLEVTETIVYPNHTGENLASLVLALEPNLWWQVFFLDSLAVEGQAVSDYTLEGQRLEIPLVAPLEPLEKVTLEIQFRLVLPYIEIDDYEPVIRKQLFGYSFRQTNLLDWYPFIVPYRSGEGWLLRDENPGGYGEHLMYEAADFDVTLRFKEAPVPVVAASGPAEELEDGFHYSLERARDFVFVISADFQVEKRDADGVTIYSYYFPFNEKSGIAAAEFAAQALEIFGQRFAPYPHPTLSIVQNPSAFAMEYDGLFILNRHLYPVSDALEMITVHEVAHQWWFGLVNSDQALEPWLDESLSTFSERVYYESLDPPRGDWWITARLYDLQPQYWLDTAIYDYGRLYMHAIYLDGAVFLQEVRERIGDEAFFDFLKGYATAYSHRIATTHDFFDLLRTYTTVDFSDIVAQYFHGTY